jgi:hypothetical protein
MASGSSSRFEFGREDSTGDGNFFRTLSESEARIGTAAGSLLRATGLDGAPVAPVESAMGIAHPLSPSTDSVAKMAMIDVFIAWLRERERPAFNCPKLPRS